METFLQGLEQDESQEDKNTAPTMSRTRRKVREEEKTDYFLPCSFQEEPAEQEKKMKNSKHLPRGSKNNSSCLFMNPYCSLSLCNVITKSS